MRDLFLNIVLVAINLALIGGVFKPIFDQIEEKNFS